MNKYPDPEDEDYSESEDEDYSPEKATQDQAKDGDSDSEDEGEQKKLDATYAKYQGRGGLIKTRAQRRAEAEGRVKVEAEPKPDAVVGESSVDVDALWQEMNAPGPKKMEPKVAITSEKPEAAGAEKQEKSTSGTPVSDTPVGDTPVSDNSNSIKFASDKPVEKDSAPLADEMITITRTFKFAGDIKTETKQVPKHSAEGRDYLQQEKLKEELRGKGRAPAKRKMSLMEEYQMNKTKKINTLEKSRLDWLGFVDKEGIKEDLSKHNKAGYLDRQDFLNRVDSKRETELRQQRAKNM